MPSATDLSDRARITVPNVLTSLRILMAAGAASCFLSRRFEVAGVGLCILGILLDTLDGWYARRFAQCSQLGNFIDPLADKIMMAVVFGTIAVNMGSLAVWLLFVLVLVRDVLVTTSRARSLQRRGICPPSGKIGKVKMFVQSGAGIGILGYGYILNGSFSFPQYPVIAALALITFLSYFSAGRSLFPSRMLATLNSKHRTSG